MAALPLYQVILGRPRVNHEMAVRVLMEVCRLDRPAAYSKIKVADKKGQSLLMVAHRERAELIFEQLISRGLDVFLADMGGEVCAK